MHLKDKVTLVTGGNSGIGRGIALLAAEEGAKVVIAARGISGNQDTAQTIRQAGGEAIFIPADLRDEAQVQRVIEETMAEYGTLHVVVNNTGAGSKLSGVEAEDAPGIRWNKLVSANFTTTY